MFIWRILTKIPSHLFTNQWLQAQQKSILSAATVITVANLLVSLSGLLRDRMLLAKFADNIVSLQAYDAFRVAFQIPDLLFQLFIVGALSASFVPIFTIMKNKSEKNAFTLVNIAMNYLILFFGLAAIIIAIFAPAITHWRIGVAYSNEQLDMVINLTRIMMIAQLFFAISSFFSGMLQSYQRFIIPALVPLLYNGGIVIGTYTFYPVLGVYAAGLGVVLGAFAHMIIQWPFVRKLNWRYQFNWNYKFPGIQKMFCLMPARTLTLGINEVQNFGLSYFVTSVAGLGYTFFVLARALVIMPIRFVGVPIGQASLPFLANLSADDDTNRFKKMVLQSLNQIAYLACPAAVLLLILRIPAVRLVFGTKNFPWEMTVLVGRMVALMAISIPAQAMFHLLVRAFHALRDTLTPFIISVFTTCLFFIGTAISVKMEHDQLLGIALTIGLVAILEAFLYIIFLNWKLKKLFTFNFVITQLKIYFISAIMAISLYIPFKFLDQVVFDTTKVVPLLALTGITAVVGLTVYILLSMLFRIQEMEILIKLFQSFKIKPRKMEPKLLLPPTEIINEVDNIDV